MRVNCVLGIQMVPTTPDLKEEKAHCLARKDQSTVKKLSDGKGGGGTQYLNITADGDVKF